MNEYTRDKLFRDAIGDLCRLRASQAKERGEREFHIGDVDTPEYRWFFDAGLDAALRVVTDQLERVTSSRIP